MSDQPGPPTLSLALTSIVGAAMDSATRPTLLSAVQPDRSATQEPGARVVPFPSLRARLGDDPDAA